MTSVTAKDALRALKKFKRLAKQDLLASELTPEPQFWRRQAEVRRSMYDVLMGLVEDEGVDAAHRYAVTKLAAPPLSGSRDPVIVGEAGEAAADVNGQRQALQLFVALFGAGDEGGDRAEQPSA